MVVAMVLEAGVEVVRVVNRAKKDFIHTLHLEKY